MIRLLLPALLLAMPAAAAAAPTIQDTASLDRAVAAFTGRPIGAEGGARTPVDTRLRLATCATLALSWHGDLHDAVVVSCTGPEWRIFVPVRAVSSAGAVTNAAEPAPTRPVAVIKRGDPVTIAAGSPGFSITREGIALGDAAVGARFMVKVDDARAPVQAVAVEGGKATLPGWSE